MAGKAFKTDYIRSPLGIISYPILETPKASGEDGDGIAKFSVAFIMRQDDLDLPKLIALAHSAVVGEWGEKALEDFGKPREDDGIKSPFLDGGRKKYADKPGYGKGTVFIRPGTTIKPELVDWNKKPIESALIYPGSAAYLGINAFAWNNAKQGRGVSFGLSAVQAVSLDKKRYPVIGGGTAATDRVFGVVDGEGAAVAGDTSGEGGAAELFG